MRGLSFACWTSPSQGLKLEESVFIAKRDLLKIRLGYRQCLNELCCTLQRNRGVVERSEDPIRAERLQSRLKYRRVSEAADRDVYLMKQHFAYASWCLFWEHGRQDLIKPGKQLRQTFAKMTNHELELWMAIEGAREGHAPRDCRRGGMKLLVTCCSGASSTHRAVNLTLMRHRVIAEDGFSALVMCSAVQWPLLANTEMNLALDGWLYEVCEIGRPPERGRRDRSYSSAPGWKPQLLKVMILCRRGRACCNAPTERSSEPFQTGMQATVEAVLKTFTCS